MKPRSDPILQICTLIIGFLLVLLLPLSSLLLSYQPDPLYYGFGVPTTIIPTINWVVSALWVKPGMLFAVAVLSFLGLLLLLEIFPMGSKRLSWILALICGLVLFCYTSFTSLSASINYVSYLGGVSYQNHEYHLFGVKYPSGPLVYALYACNSFGWQCEWTKLPADINRIEDIPEIESLIPTLPASP